MGRFINAANNAQVFGLVFGNDTFVDGIRNGLGDGGERRRRQRHVIDEGPVFLVDLDNRHLPKYRPHQPRDRARRGFEEQRPLAIGGVARAVHAAEPRQVVGERILIGDEVAAAELLDWASVKAVTGRSGMPTWLGELPEGTAPSRLGG